MMKLTFIKEYKIMKYTCHIGKALRINLEIFKFVLKKFENY